MRLRTLIFSFTLLFALRAQAQERAVRLPTTVNSDQNELAPVISTDGNTLYFARPRMALDSSIVVDIWRSVRDSTGKFGRAEIMGDALSSRFGIAVTSVAPDNNSLYLMGKMQEDTPPEDRIYVTHRTRTGWSVPESLHIDSLRVRGTYTDYSFGPDQKTLVMAVERDSTLGGRDLYVSFLDESHNRWSSPRWLGAEINSRFTEMTPYLAADGRTLYFSSDRPNGFGDVDVYRSVRLDESWQHWTRPENMGPTINRPGRTVYYTEDAKGAFAYFVWRPNISTQTDIYVAKVPRKKASAVALVSGRVLDNEGHPLSAKVRYQRLSDGFELGVARTDPATGAYQLILPAGALYGIRAQKQGFAPTIEHVDVTAVKDFETVHRDLILTPIRKGAIVRLNSVFFETDKSMLLPDSYPELDHLTELLMQDPKMRISIEGHTDSIGSSEHNTTLSKNRAEAVRSYLVSKGIAPERLAVEAYGPTRPIAPNDTEDGRSKNRRVEFRVLESSITAQPADEGD